MQEDALMKSQNFEFLRPRHRELADLGGFAEAYARPDPAGALVKLRSFIETLVAIIYETYRLPRPYASSSIARRHRTGTSASTSPPTRR
jgi:hypothetical protein